MLTRYETRKLQRDMKHELDATPAAVLKCAAGLLIFVALAVVGSVTDLRHDVGGPVAAVTQITDSGDSRLSVPLRPEQAK